MTLSSAFSDLGLSPDILQSIEEAGYTTPTAIQAEGVPAFLDGSDIVFQAQTGTGKTAAFVLPIIQQLEPRPGVVEVLVLTPTRELAQQVCEEFDRFGKGRGITATAIYGGTSFEKQYEALETAQVVVATPGRLLDLFRRKKFSADKVRFFGLDEADELLSMGFEKDVLDIAEKVPTPRQSFICSATFSDAVQRVARNFIVDPVQVNVSSDAIGAQSVRHEYFAVRPSEKLDALRRLVVSEARSGAIVFANTRAATFRVTEALVREGVSVDVLNGELSQAEREKALARMKDDRVQFLVATDVAARGIDISGLPAVINYDMPESPDVYIHRTGRTGRAGQAGVAFSLVMPSDITVFHALQKFYKLELHERTLPTRQDIRAAVADDAIDGTLSTLDADGTLEYAAHIPLARRLTEREDGARVIAKLIAHFREGNGTAHGAKARPAAAPSPATPVVATTPEPPPPTVESPAEAAEPTEATPSRQPASRDATEGPRRSRSRTAAVEATAPEREERKDRKTPETEEAVASTAPASTSGDAPTPDAIASVLAESSRRRGRWRGARSIAEALGVDEAAVVTVLEAGPEQFEQSRKNPNQWRLLVSDGGSASPDGDKPERKSAPPSERPEKSERREAAPAEKPRKSDKPARGSNDARKSSDAKPAKQTAPKAGPDHVFVKVNVGTTHGISADQLAAELVHLAGLDLEDLGPVELGETESRVAVVSDYSDALAEAIDGQTVAGQTLSVKRPQRRGRRK
jgi:ATP-dependent RNA helicase DeaD